MEAPTLIVVGSVAYDSIETPAAKVPDVLGGSATYFSLAAAVQGVPTGVVAVVGSDFRDPDRKLLESRGVNTEGLAVAAGETFRWGGRYDVHLKDRDTLYTHLNVFASFQPRLPQAYKDAPFVFLANIDPDLQAEVLRQSTGPRWVACDTMNFWIHSKRQSLLNLLPKVDTLFLNDSEAFDLTGSRNVVTAARWIMDHGTPTVVVKRGEHGVVVVSAEEVFTAPAFLHEAVQDPTGAGDSFGGGFAAAIARMGEVNKDTLRIAATMGTVTASFCVQEFGPQGLAALTPEVLKKRLKQYRNRLRIPVLEW
jgi:sugar/nucleoside kinase (ribokinase family)